MVSQTSSGGSMEKQRTWFSICTILLALAVMLGAVGLAAAQQDPERQILKGPFVPQARVQSFAPPANDDCGGAAFMPDGPYRVQTPSVGMSDATTGSDPVAPCAPTEKGAWWTWTPAAWGFYIVTTVNSGTNTGADTVMN